MNALSGNRIGDITLTLTYRSGCIDTCASMVRSTTSNRVFALNNLDISPRTSVPTTANHKPQITIGQLCSKFHSSNISTTEASSFSLDHQISFSEQRDRSCHTVHQASLSCRTLNEALQAPNRHVPARLRQPSRLRCPKTHMSISSRGRSSWVSPNYTYTWCHLTIDQPRNTATASACSHVLHQWPDAVNSVRAD